MGEVATVEDLHCIITQNYYINEMSRIKKTYFIMSQNT